MHRTIVGLLALAVIGVGCSGSPPAAGSAAIAGAPTASIDSPSAGAVVPIGQELAVRVSASDASGVSRIDLQVDGVVVDSFTTPGASGQPTLSAQLGWTPTAEGAHALSAIAYRPNGTASVPATIAISATAGPLPSGALSSGPVPSGTTVAGSSPSGAPAKTPKPAKSPKVATAAPSTPPPTAAPTTAPPTAAPTTAPPVTLPPFKTLPPFVTIPPFSTIPPFKTLPPFFTVPPISTLPPVFFTLPPLNPLLPEPDLVVSLVDTSVKGNFIQTQVKVGVANAGAGDAGSFVVSIQTGGQSKTKSVGGLGAGESATVTVGFGTIAIGPSIQIVVDQNDDVAESDEGNNGAVIE